MFRQLSQAHNDDDNNNNNLSEVKQNIMDYFNTYPDAMNAEAIIDLGLDKLTWHKATKELFYEGKIKRKVKHTFTYCMNTKHETKTDHR